MGSWWRDAVLYEAYVRSFADSSGDGVGDLEGIRARLPHLIDLGVDGIWLTPFYRSPMADHGYDVADPRDVDPLFGDLEAFDALLSDAHAAGLKILVDLVPNHSSDAHLAFVAALEAGPGSPERDRYLFRDGRGPGGDEPPNNWVSVFGGPAWARVPDGQWYLHLFAPEQPDWNWDNPDVWADHDATIRFWLDRGVDGFRVDVTHGLVKAAGLPDNPPGIPLDPHSNFRELAEPAVWDQDGVHAIYRHWREILDGYDRRDGRDRVMVGETWVADPRRLARYVRPDELHLTFGFSLLAAPWDATAWREAITSDMAATAEVGAPVTWVVANHDVTRPVTRYGEGEIGLRRARAAMLALLALPGPVFLYQGDELGLPEVDVAPADRRDPVWERSGHTSRGRDGCRVPMPWSGSAPPFGFSADGVAPWLPQPTEWAALTAQVQGDDPLSTLVLVRGAIAVRKALAALGDGPLHWRDTPDPACLMFDRPAGDGVTVDRPAGDGVTVTCAMSSAGHEVTLTVPGRLVLASNPVGYDGATLTLPPDTTAWIVTSR